MKNTTPRRTVTLAALLPDLPGSVPPSAVVGVVPKCEADYPGFDQELLVDLLSANSAADKVTADEDSPEWKAAMKEFRRRNNDVCRAVDLMLLDAFQKGQKAPAVEVDAADKTPVEVPAAPVEPWRILKGGHILRDGPQEDPRCFTETAKWHAALQMQFEAIREWEAQEPIEPPSVGENEDRKFAAILDAALVAEVAFSRVPEDKTHKRQHNRAFEETMAAREAVYAATNERLASAFALGMREAKRQAAVEAAKSEEDAVPSVSIQDVPAPEGETLDVHKLLYDTLQTIGFHDLLTVFADASAQLQAYAHQNVKAPGDETKAGYQARAALLGTTRKAVRSAVGQFGQQMFLAGLEAQK